MVLSIYQMICRRAFVVFRRTGGILIALLSRGLIISEADDAGARRVRSLGTREACVEKEVSDSPPGRPRFGNGLVIQSRTVVSTIALSSPEPPETPL